MSGHSKWATIKHKKGAADAKRGKIFSRLAKEITLAAKAGGGDAAMNPRLRTALNAAKAANMPNDNVSRAIKKGTGELEGGALIEMTYEGFAPGGVAVIVYTMTDNKNRTAADIRSTFTRHNSNLGANGSVSRIFHRRSRFVVEGPHANEDKLLELLLDKGVDVEDVTVSDSLATIIAAADAFGDVVVALESAGIPISESSLTMVASTSVEHTDAGIARQVVRLIETLEENEDVTEVFSNFEMSDALMGQLAAE